MKKMYAGRGCAGCGTNAACTQAALAKALELSTSYVNQLENDQRPMTVPVLLQLNSDVRSGRAVLRRRHRRPAGRRPPRGSCRNRGVGERRPQAESRNSSPGCPRVGQTLVTLHRRLHAATEQLDSSPRSCPGMAAPESTRRTRCRSRRFATSSTTDEPHRRARRRRRGAVRRTTD